MKLKTHYPRPRSVASHLACWSHDSVLTLVTGGRLMSQLILFLVRSHLLNLINNTLSMTTQVQISVCLSVFLVQDILLGQCSILQELCSASLLICWKTNLLKRSCFLVENKNPSFELPTNEKVAKRGTTNNTPAVPPVDIKCCIWCLMTRLW